MGAYHWSAEHDALLKACLIDGMSYSAAAAALNLKFGTAFTRCAVIGRARRVDLRTLSCHRVVKVPTPSPWERLGITAPPPAGRARACPPPPAARGRRPLRCDPVTPRRLALHELTVESCRWPVGGWPTAEPVTFCGQPRMGDKSYCAGHFMLSIIASRPAPLAALEEAA